MKVYQVVWLSSGDTDERYPVSSLPGAGLFPYHIDVPSRGIQNNWQALVAMWIDCQGFTGDMVPNRWWNIS